VQQSRNHQSSSPLFRWGRAAIGFHIGNPSQEDARWCCFSELNKTISWFSIPRNMLLSLVQPELPNPRAPSSDAIPALHRHNHQPPTVNSTCQPASTTPSHAPMRRVHRPRSDLHGSAGQAPSAVETGESSRVLRLPTLHLSYPRLTPTACRLLTTCSESQEALTLVLAKSADDSAGEA
jgi:hypothetical protein